MKTALIWFALLVGVALPVLAEDGGGGGLVFSADKYDPERDAFSDFETSKAIAKRDGRHILLLVGGDWCPWCRKLAKYIEENEAVAALLAEFFVVQKVNVSDEQSNTFFLNPLGVIDAYPHVFFLDADGKVLHSLNTATLEKSGSYDEAKLVAVLKERVPKEAVR